MVKVIFDFVYVGLITFFSYSCVTLYCPPAMHAACLMAPQKVFSRLTHPYDDVHYYHYAKAKPPHRLALTIQPPSPRLLNYAARRAVGSGISDGWHEKTAFS